MIAGPTRKAFYSGDTGYFPGFAEIGEEHGPFDVTLVQIGAYGDAWPDIHMVPEDGVATHVDVRGGLMIPVHWGTFNLALHDWAEPADRAWREAKARDVRLAVPRPGERVDVDHPPPGRRLVAGRSPECGSWSWQRAVAGGWTVRSRRHVAAAEPASCSPGRRGGGAADGCGGRPPCCQAGAGCSLRECRSRTRPLGTADAVAVTITVMRSALRRSLPGGTGLQSSGCAAAGRAGRGPAGRWPA